MNNLNHRQRWRITFDTSLAKLLALTKSLTTLFALLCIQSTWADGNLNPSSGTLAKKEDWERFPFGGNESVVYSNAKGAGWAGSGLGVHGGSHRGLPEFMSIEPTPAPIAGKTGAKSLAYRSHQRTAAWRLLHPENVDTSVYRGTDPQSHTGQDDYAVRMRVADGGRWDSSHLPLATMGHFYIQNGYQGFRLFSRDAGAGEGKSPYGMWIYETFVSLRRARTTRGRRYQDVFIRVNDGPPFTGYNAGYFQALPDSVRHYIRNEMPASLHNRWVTAGLVITEDGDGHYFFAPEYVTEFDPTKHHLGSTSRIDSTNGFSDRVTARLTGGNGNNIGFMSINSPKHKLNYSDSIARYNNIELYKDQTIHYSDGFVKANIPDVWFLEDETFEITSGDPDGVLTTDGHQISGWVSLTNAQKTIEVTASGQTIRKEPKSYTFNVTFVPTADSKPVKPAYYRSHGKFGQLYKYTNINHVAGHYTSTRVAGHYLGGSANDGMATDNLRYYRLYRNKLEVYSSARLMGKGGKGDLQSLDNYGNTRDGIAADGTRFYRLYGKYLEVYSSAARMGRGGKGDIASHRNKGNTQDGIAAYNGLFYRMVADKMQVYNNPAAMAAAGTGNVNSVNLRGGAFDGFAVGPKK